jgi:phenylalanyl-tRNA synthetase beta chain
MPTLDIDLAEFEKLLGVAFCGNMERLDDLLAFVKSEVKLYDKNQGLVSVEMKDTNRPDLWSVEGLARALRCFLNLEKGFRPYHLDESTLEVNVDARLKSIRPFIACSIIKNVNLTDTVIRGFMRMQDKLDKTYGRSRQKTSIGIYCLDLISPPLTYGVVEPSSFSFVPLGFSEKMTLKEILEMHPKGQEYGSIVKGHRLYPILLDAKQKVLSFPPIINSNDLGRVTEEAHNLLVEVTGTLDQTVRNTLTLVTTAIVDRGGKAFSATVNYPSDPFYSEKKVKTPDFSFGTMTLDVNYANKISGLKLSSKRIEELLLNAGLGVGSLQKDSVEVQIPCYRIDVMHPIDIVEDVAVAYGYNDIEPLWRDLPTSGSARLDQRLIDTCRELMVGAGYQEILSYTLTNPESLFTKMNRAQLPIVSLANPKLVTMTCLRNWLLPGIVEFLSLNQSVEFPQRVFELGKVTFPDDASETRTRDEEWLAAATSHASAGFSEIKACLDVFLLNLGFELKIKPTSNPTFIEGRTGAVVVNEKEVGLVGEVNPIVLEAWELENPMAAFEINLQSLLDQKRI